MNVLIILQSDAALMISSNQQGKHMTLLDYSRKISAME